MMTLEQKTEILDLLVADERFNQKLEKRWSRDEAPSYEVKYHLIAVFEIMLGYLAKENASEYNIAEIDNCEISDYIFDKTVDFFMERSGWLSYNSRFYRKSCMVTAITGCNAENNYVFGPVPDKHVEICAGSCARSFSGNYLTLSGRGASIRLNESFDDGQHHFVCRECVKEFESCYDCNQMDKPEHLEAVDNRPRCSTCAESYFENRAYFKNTFRMGVCSEQTPTMRHIGCEIETYIKPKSTMAFNSDHVFQVKHDGSLTSKDRGLAIELVTQPLGSDRSVALTNIFKELNANQATIDSTCGAHIHVNASNLNLTTERRAALVRDMFRVYEGAFYAVTIKGRIESTYCAPVSFGDVKTDESRYHSLNFLSYPKYDTLEFRMFSRSTETQKWLDRISLSEGFVNFAYGLLEQHGRKYSQLEKAIKNLTPDSGFSNLESSYYRARDLREMIQTRGEDLINLACTSFQLDSSLVTRLVKLHKTLWNK